ncbi:MAG: carboxypeptidase-like regulatory domain-containing protein, partial [Tannerellaceae bacterium]
MKINQQGWKKFFFLFTGLFILLTASAQSGGKIKVTGIVKDEIGEPIIGASISEKGEPTNGTISDIDGNFTLDVAANGILHVSYIGYITQDVPVNG